MSQKAGPRRTRPRSVARRAMRPSGVSRHRRRRAQQVTLYGLRRQEASDIVCVFSAPACPRRGRRDPRFARLGAGERSGMWSFRCLAGHVTPAGSSASHCACPSARCSDYPRRDLDRRPDRLLRSTEPNHRFNGRKRLMAACGLSAEAPSSDSSNATETRCCSSTRIDGGYGATSS